MKWWRRQMAGWRRLGGVVRRKRGENVAAAKYAKIMSAAGNLSKEMKSMAYGINVNNGVYPNGVWR
jgi:hypothetical protein